jgi:electron transfer flavoprotein beta subunit
LKILVAITTVPDPDNVDRVQVRDGAVDTSLLESKLNPFDECAVEAALRLTEDGRTPKVRQGEVVVTTVGAPGEEKSLRQAMSIGADRGILVEADPSLLDGRVVAHVLRALVAREKPDLVLLGKQAVDTEAGHVGPALAAMLDCPAVICATSITESDGKLLVERERDGKQVTFRITLPAVVTVDLRVVTAAGARSDKTPGDFEYYDGVRFASLLAVMQAKRKPLATIPIDEVSSGVEPIATYREFALPEARKPGVVVHSVAELADKLCHEAAVL